MKITFEKSELESLIYSVKIHSGDYRFYTTFESKIVGAIVKPMLFRIQKKLLVYQKKYIINFENMEVLALNQILPQTAPKDPYHRAVIVSITEKINKECLNI